MEIKFTAAGSYSLAEIQKNGKLVSSSNPVSRSEYSEVDFGEANGEIIVISGMPTDAIAMVACRYKNQFAVVAIAVPRDGVATVVHSISPKYTIGDEIPLV